MRHATFLALLSVVMISIGSSPRGAAIGQQPATTSVAGLRTADGLEVTLWAAEPALTNPTNIAIDERGRVWVLEAVNYRRQLRNQPDLRPDGDRIVILEDTDGDGRADTSKVFDQGPHIRAPLGIAVFGDRVIVSQSPDLIAYTKDGRDRIVKKEVLLTGWGGADHDHGLHAVVYGPDGRYYFNAGNEGYDVTDRAGRRVRSPRGSGPGGGAGTAAPDWGGGAYFEGAAMVVNPDGTGLQVLAQNFRNPYELAIDAFGDIWQTDNDDDGNAWTRANYVMEGGNYGFRGPYGRRWQDDAGSHFHEELPGVVPNLLRLGPGSPCGLVVYEGRLLPEAYRGNLLHAEAGRRVIAHYPLSAEGAGFQTKIDETVFGGDDTWFRPSDVAVAPDGAVFIADWYDPAVGGHGMGDAQGARGRLYRLAPRGHAPRVGKVDLQSETGLIAAFESPAQSVFYLARTELARRGAAARPLLQRLWGGRDPVVRARALWLLGERGADGMRHVQDALRDPDPRFRVLALRVLRRSGADMLAASRPLLRDPSAQVRREIAVMLQDPARMTPAYVIGEQTSPPPDVLAALVELAKQYDGKDRWYLAALGIAARGREDALYERLRSDAPQLTAVTAATVPPATVPPSTMAPSTMAPAATPATIAPAPAAATTTQAPATAPATGGGSSASLLRELRAPASLPHLIAVLQDRARPDADRLQALDVVSVMSAPEATRAVEALIVADGTPPAVAERAFVHLRRQLFSLWSEARTSPTLPAVVRKALATPALQASGVDLASALGDPQFASDLLALAKSPAANEAVRAAAIDAVALDRDAARLPDYDQLLTTGPSAVRVSAMHAIGLLAPPDIEQRAQAVLLGDAPNEVRSEALRVLARSAAGLDMLTSLEQSGKFPPELKRLATSLVQARGPFRIGRPPVRTPTVPGPRPGPGGAAQPGTQPAAPDPRAEAAAAAFAAARERAAKVFPLPVTANAVAVPTIRQMEQNFRVDVAAGRKVFDGLCGACHSLGGAKQMGPDLSAIGAKLDRQALLDAIVMPSAAISFGYESWVMETTTDGRVTGLLVENTPERVVLKVDATQEIRLKPSAITSRRPIPVSVMPEGLINAMTPQQIVDLIGFLTTLKPSQTASAR